MLKKATALLALCLSMSVYADAYVKGFYMVSPTTDKNYETAKSMGVTHVHAYLNAYSEKGEESLQLQLDTAEKHGLKVMFNLIRAGVEKEPNGLEKIRAVVRRFKDHPALGFWYLYDEPSGPEMVMILERVYAMLKQETPNIPVALCLAQTQDWRSFVPHCDILMGDQYPVHDEPFPEAPLFRYSNFIRDMAAYGKPVIAIPQFMNWRCYPSVSASYEQANLRYPNDTELRYFFYSALAIGNSAGVFWYSFYDILRLGNREYFDEMRPLMLEMRKFADLLKEPEKAQVFMWARDSNFYMSLIDKKYLVLVNNYPIKQKVERWTENIIKVDTDLKPWGSTRAVKAEIRNNRFKLEGFIEPWESLVWEIVEK